MSDSYETHQIDWCGIRIEVRYCPSWLQACEETYGEPMAHLTLEAIDPSRSPLPMTETGYRSHFTSPQIIESEGGPVAFVLGWLDALAASQAWIAREAAARQLSLL